MALWPILEFNNTIIWKEVTFIDMLSESIKKRKLHLLIDW